MIACSAIFYALYHFFLSKEKTLVFNRFYLLGGLFASFLIPLITVTVMVDAPEQSNYGNAMPMEAYQASIDNFSIQDYLIDLTYIIVASVSIVLLVRFIKNLVAIKRKTIKYKQFVLEGANVVLSEKTTPPYSFLNTIFLNKAEYEQGQIELEVLTHELAHVHQKHSYDILFIELLQVFFWFNPFLYLYKQSIKTNHELLADSTVVEQFGDVHNYQHILLLRSISTVQSLQFTSSFNYFTTKKRLIMLQKPFIKKRVFIVGLAVIPALAFALFAGCNTKEKPRSPADSTIGSTSDSLRKNSALTATKTTSDSVPPPPPHVETKPLPPSKTVTKPIPPPIVVPDKPKSPPPIVVPDYGPGATPSELDEYESIVGKIKAGKNRYRGRLSDQEFTLVHRIFMKMNKEQRKLSSGLPIPPPPLPILAKKLGFGATQAEMEEYETIVGKIKANKNLYQTKLSDDEYRQINQIYTKMNKGQRKVSIKLPLPSPVEPKNGNKPNN